MLGLVNLMLAFSAKIGYWGIVLLMTIESSFIPFPSEIIIPPAAYLAAQGQFNIYLVILSGIVGSLLGALINYFLAMTLGRKIVYSLANKKIAKLLLINEQKIQKAEDYFKKYGSISTFLGRLVPAIRQLISIPAGFCRMKLGSFLFFTFLGSGLWTVILAVLGYAFGANDELLEKYYKQASFAALGIVILVIAYLILKKRSSKKLTSPEENKQQ